MLKKHLLFPFGQFFNSHSVTIPLILFQDLGCGSKGKIHIKITIINLHFI